MSGDWVKSRDWPAFPSTLTMGQHKGLTVRDYFAAKALQGFTACADTEWETALELADRCYALADAMLQARLKP